MPRAQTHGPKSGWVNILQHNTEYSAPPNSTGIMAQAAAMGPPLSPRETRRSGRHSLPSASTSTSKSPDSDPVPGQKDIPQRPPLSSSNSSARNKRLKQEDLEESVDDRKNGSAPSHSSASSTHGLPNGRTKRKAKEKEKLQVITDLVAEIPPGSGEDLAGEGPEEEEQGITRCVCGSTGMYHFFLGTTLTITHGLLVRRGRPGCW